MQFTVGTGLEAETLGTRTRASGAGTNVVHHLKVIPNVSLTLLLIKGKVP